MSDSKSSSVSALWIALFLVFQLAVVGGGAAICWMSSRGVENQVERRLAATTDRIEKCLSERQVVSRGPDVVMRDITNVQQNSTGEKDAREKSILSILSNLLKRIEVVELQDKATKEGIAALQRQIQDLQWTLDTNSKELKQLPDRELPRSLTGKREETTIEEINN